ncbi:hypothetical protein L5515_016984 [Caenorhabditis briggsae]|uniref:Uncharacterized protein n=1 Tax=Caenorhabditis briggsae TaxID=6238 RepID=A0AAE9FC63_CAEBR|nr:hypothetical protein L5515_016984 [Caenorhabditis briggsae]
MSKPGETSGTSVPKSYEPSKSALDNKDQIEKELKRLVDERKEMTAEPSGTSETLMMKYSKPSKPALYSKNYHRIEEELKRMEQEISVHGEARKIVDQDLQEAAERLAIPGVTAQDLFLIKCKMEVIEKRQSVGVWLEAASHIPSAEKPDPMLEDHADPADPQTENENLTIQKLNLVSAANISSAPATGAPGPSKPAPVNKNHQPAVKMTAKKKRTAKKRKGKGKPQISNIPPVPKSVSSVYTSPAASEKSNDPAQQNNQLLEYPDVLCNVPMQFAQHPPAQPAPLPGDDELHYVPDVMIGPHNQQECEHCIIQNHPVMYQPPVQAVPIYGVPAYAPQPQMQLQYVRQPGFDQPVQIYVPGQGVMNYVPYHLQEVPVYQQVQYHPQPAQYAYQQVPQLVIPEQYENYPVSTLDQTIEAVVANLSTQVRKVLTSSMFVGANVDLISLQLHVVGSEDRTSSLSGLPIHHNVGVTNIFHQNPPQVLINGGVELASGFFGNGPLTMQSVAPLLKPMNTRNFRLPDEDTASSSTGTGYTSRETSPGNATTANTSTARARVLPARFNRRPQPNRSVPQMGPHREHDAASGPSAGRRN